MIHETHTFVPAIWGEQSRVHSMSWIPAISRSEDRSHWVFGDLNFRLWRLLDLIEAGSEAVCGRRALGNQSSRRAICWSERKMRENNIEITQTLIEHLHPLRKISNFGTWVPINKFSRLTISKQLLSHRPNSTRKVRNMNFYQNRVIHMALLPSNSSENTEKNN